MNCDNANESGSSPKQKFSNISSILNDPSNSRSELSKLFTQTWGSQFVEQPLNLRHVNLNFYKTYLSSLLCRHTIQKQKVDEENEEDYYEIVPKIYFQTSFTLTNTSNFNSVFEIDADGINSVFRKKLLHEKLGHYLDVVETNLGRQIASRSSVFFMEMTTYNDILNCILTTSSVVKSVRQNLAHYKESILKKNVKLLAFLNRQKRSLNVYRLLKLLSAMYHTLPYVRQLISSAEYNSAVNLISTMRDILSQELKGVLVTKCIDEALDEMDTMLMRLMDNDVRRFISTYVANIPNYYEYELEPLFVPLLKKNPLNVITACNEELTGFCNSYLSKIMNEFLSSNIHGKENLVSGKEFVGNTLVLSFSEWKSLLAICCNRIVILIESIKTFLKKLIVLFHSLQEENESNSDLITMQRDFNCLEEIIIEKLQKQLIKVLNTNLSKDNIEKMSLTELEQLLKIVLELHKNLRNISTGDINLILSWIKNSASSYVENFHEQRKCKISEILQTEKWLPCDVPLGYQKLLETNLGELVDDTLLKGEEVSDSLQFNGEHYVVCSPSIQLIGFVYEYCYCESALSQFNSEIFFKLLEILKLFNSRTCQLILGAGAIEMAGLRTISARNLGIACRSLQLICQVLIRIKNYLIKMGSNSLSLRRQFEQLEKDYINHIEEIFTKCVSMADLLVDHTLSTYEVIAPMPSDSFRNIVKQLTKLHESLRPLIPHSDVVKLFVRIDCLFKSKLKERLTVLDVRNDGGPLHGLVNADISFYTHSIRSLYGMDTVSLNNVW